MGSLKLMKKVPQVYRRALMPAVTKSLLYTRRHIYNACALNNFPRYIGEH